MNAANIESDQPVRYSLPQVPAHGRQGLFEHDKPRRALAMAYAAERCFRADDFDHVQWAIYREVFTHHEVED